MCYRESVLTGRKILFLAILNLSFWAGFFQRQLDVLAGEREMLGFSSCGLVLIQLASWTHHCIAVASSAHTAFLFFSPSLARLDLQMFLASAHPKSSQASSLRLLIPA